MVICPDFPGLGDSALPPPAESPAPVAAVIRAGIGQVLGAGTRYDLCGFSYRRAARPAMWRRRRADELRSVTLVGAGALGPKRQITDLSRSAARRARRASPRTGTTWRR